VAQVTQVGYWVVEVIGSICKDEFSLLDSSSSVTLSNQHTGLMEVSEHSPLSVEKHFLRDNICSSFSVSYKLL